MGKGGVSRELLSIAAIALTFIAYFPYIRSIRRSTTKPHVFSWVIWGASTFIVFFAQLAGDGGAGAWPTCISGLISLYVAWLAHCARADESITRADRVFFTLAAISLPLWYFTDDPLTAVVLLTLADVLGCGPTFRKAWYKPYEEHATFFGLIVLRNCLAIAGLEHYSFTTVLFPVASAICCVAISLMVVYRRWVILNMGQRGNDD